MYRSRKIFRYQYNGYQYIFYLPQILYLFWSKAVRVSAILAGLRGFAYSNKSSIRIFHTTKARFGSSSPALNITNLNKKQHFCRQRQQGYNHVQSSISDSCLFISSSSLIPVTLDSFSCMTTCIQYIAFAIEGDVSHTSFTVFKHNTCQLAK